MIQEGQAKFDAVLAAGAIASPWWLTLFDNGLHVLLGLGGGILLLLRIAIVYRDWRRRR